MIVLICGNCLNIFFVCSLNLHISLSNFIFEGQNLIHELPESFGNLCSLRVCLLSKNHLQLLPSSFGNLASLEDVRLDDNEVR